MILIVTIALGFMLSAWEERGEAGLSPEYQEKLAELKHDRSGRNFLIMISIIVAFLGVYLLSDSLIRFAPKLPIQEIFLGGLCLVVITMASADIRKLKNEGFPEEFIWRGKARLACGTILGIACLGWMYVIRPRLGG